MKCEFRVQHEQHHYKDADAVIWGCSNRYSQWCDQQWTTLRSHSTKEVCSIKPRVGLTDGFSRPAPAQFTTCPLCCVSAGMALPNRRNWSLQKNGETRARKNGAFLQCYQTSFLQQPWTLSVPSCHHGWAHSCKICARQAARFIPPHPIPRPFPPHARKKAVRRTWPKEDHGNDDPALLNSSLNPSLACPCHLPVADTTLPLPVQPLCRAHSRKWDNVSFLKPTNISQRGYFKMPRSSPGRCSAPRGTAPACSKR